MSANDPALPAAERVRATWEAYGEAMRTDPTGDGLACRRAFRGSWVAWLDFLGTRPTTLEGVSAYAACALEMAAVGGATEYASEALAALAGQVHDSEAVLRRSFRLPARRVVQAAA